MDIQTLRFILALSCLLPATLGAIYYSRIEKSFHPFCWAMWLSLFTEICMNVLMINNGPWMPFRTIASLYFLLNPVFYFLFFYRQKIIAQKMFWMLIALHVLVYIINCFFQSPLKNYLLGTSMFGNLIIFLLSCKLLSSQVFNLHGSLLKNPLFIIGCGATMFCAIFLFIKVIYILQGKSEFNTFIHDIFRYVNAATYLVFTWAFICIANLKKFIKQPVIPQQT